MSTIIMAQCWPLQGLSATQKAVLISLADQANDHGVCWPSVKTISVRTCLSERAVRASIAWLTENGLLLSERRFNSSNIYTISVANFKQTSQEISPIDGGAYGAGGAQSAGGGAYGAGGAASGAGLEVHHVPTNRNGTINEPSMNRHISASAPLPEKVKAISKPVDVGQQVWDDFKQHRKSHKAAITQTALDGIQREALKAGMSFEDALRTCVERNWRGFSAKWMLDKPAYGQKPQGGTINGVGVSAVGMQNYATMQAFLAKKAAKTVDMEGQ